MRGGPADDGHMADLPASVADRAADVGERITVRRVVAPLIVAPVQRQLEDPERRVMEDDAVGVGEVAVVERLAAGSDDEAADSAGAVKGAIGVLRLQALVEVLVPGEHEVRAGVVERLPEGDRLLGPAPFLARERAEQRVVPEGQGARPAVAGEIRGEPLLLRRPEAAASRYVVAVGVQRDDVPRADLEAVVAAPHAIAGATLQHAGAVEVVEVPGGAWG